jgi:hypothetical protein
MQTAFIYQTWPTRPPNIGQDKLRKLYSAILIHPQGITAMRIKALWGGVWLFYLKIGLFQMDEVLREPRMKSAALFWLHNHAP